MIFKEELTIEQLNNVIDDGIGSFIHKVNRSRISSFIKTTDSRNTVLFDEKDGIDLLVIINDEECVMNLDQIAFIAFQESDMVDPVYVRLKSDFAYLAIEFGKIFKVTHYDSSNKVIGIDGGPERIPAAFFEDASDDDSIKEITITNIKNNIEKIVKNAEDSLKGSISSTRDKISQYSRELYAQYSALQEEEQKLKGIEENRLTATKYISQANAIAKDNRVEKVTFLEDGTMCIFTVPVVIEVDNDDIDDDDEDERTFDLGRFVIELRLQKGNNSNNDNSFVKIRRSSNLSKRECHPHVGSFVCYGNLLDASLKAAATGDFDTLFINTIELLFSYSSGSPFSTISNYKMSKSNPSKYYGISLIS